MTPKQQRVLDFIVDRIRTTRLAPTYQEIVDHLDVKSKSRVYATVNMLVENGYLVRLPEKVRGIGLPPQGLAEIPTSVLRGELERRTGR